MRVLYVNHTAEVSGGERSLLDLLGALPGAVQPLVACPHGRLADAVAELGVARAEIRGTAGSLRLHPLHTPRALAEMGHAAVQVNRLARGGVELVHANSIRAGIVVGLARPRGPGVVHVRDCLPPGTVTSATMRLIAATATSVIANSAYTAASVRAAAPSANVEVVHNPVDLRRWSPEGIDRERVRAELGVPEGRLLLGVVAQLSPWKGQDTAIEALAELGERGVDASLLLIGSAKFVAASTRFDNERYVAELRELAARRGVAERVAWLGEREDVPRLMRALDVLLLPSHEEPFGRAVIEAMAMGVPPVATLVGGPSEVIADGEDGYLLAPDDPGAWAEVLAGLAAEPERRRALGLAGRAKVERSYTVEHHAASVLAVYERALARHSAS
jgi:glycosyltransferase involved in cell wall biosynthesis